MKVRGRIASKRSRSGMTLMEMTVVILVLLALVAVLFVGAQGWKRGTDRARCILNIRQMQMSVRAYQTASEYENGEDLSTHIPPLSLLGELVGPGKYVPELPRCPGNGIYFFGDDVLPEPGVLYLRCSLASEGHLPKGSENW